ncbi:MAG: hypothetical protein CMM58_04970 [Rhodospirillaceae bacterium]|nr:hypothetical protein [Rhodospirillaceae bacterium]
MNILELINECRPIDFKEENQHLKRIRSSGYTVIEQVLNDQLITKLLTKVLRNFDGQSSLPIAEVPMEWDANWVLNLQNKDKEFIDLLDMSIVKRLMMASLNDPHFRHFPVSDPNYILGQFVARSSVEELELHIDAGMPQPGKSTTMMQLSFILEDVTLENGCTVVVPGSHLLGEYSDRDYKNVIPIPARAGDILVWDARLWHGSRKNITKKTRWCIIATFQRWWIKQSFDIPRGLPQNIYAQLTNKQKALLGYSTVPPINEKERRTRAMKYSELADTVDGFYKKK